jgi:hypothetical protein
MSATMLSQYRIIQLSDRELVDQTWETLHEVATESDDNVREDVEHLYIPIGGAVRDGN